MTFNPSANDCSYCGLIAEPAVQSYTIDLKVPVPCRIQEFTVKLDSGTATVKLQIDGVDVTGSSISATSSEQSVTPSAANTAAAGTTIALVCTAESSPVNLAFTIRATSAV